MIEAKRSKKKERKHEVFGGVQGVERGFHEQTIQFKEVALEIESKR